MTEKFDILTFGSLTLDTIIDMPENDQVELIEGGADGALKIPLGEKIAINQAASFCGGGSANPAVGFAKMGLKTAAFGVLGDQSNQAFLLSELRKNQVNTDYLTIAKGQESSFSVILHSWDGRRTVFHKRTSCQLFGQNLLDKTPDTKALYIGHLYDCANDLMLKVPAWKERHPGTIIGWNPGSTQFKKGDAYFAKVFPHIDTLILNVEEAERFLGMKSKKHNFDKYDPEICGQRIIAPDQYEPDFLRDIRPLAQKFINLGVHTVMITDGSRGTQVFSGTDHFWSPPKKAKRVDSLGAGDAFSVGVMAAKVHGYSLLDQIKWGTLNATSVIGKLGAQPGQLYLNDIPTNNISITVSLKTKKQRSILITKD